MSEKQGGPAPGENAHFFDGLRGLSGHRNSPKRSFQ